MRQLVHAPYQQDSLSNNVRAVKEADTYRSGQLPADSVRLLGDVPVVSLLRVMKCEKCGYKDYLQIEVLNLSASERQAVKVRHFVEVKVRKLPVWRED